jgi:hypothetical protein
VTPVNAINRSIEINIHFIIFVFIIIFKKSDVFFIQVEFNIYKINSDLLLYVQRINIEYIYIHNK